VSRKPRFYVPNAQTRREIRLDPAQAHHALRVMRLKAGDALILFNQHGEEFEARLTTDDAGAAGASILSRLPARNRVRRQVTLAFAPPRGKRADFLVEKCTELGVCRFIPLLAQRTASTARRIGEGRLARWRRIATQAAQQCARDSVPDIDAPLNVQEALSLAPEYDETWMADPGGERPPVSLACSDASMVLAMVGPEGGFTQSELRAALTAGAASVSLGGNVLRVETACVAVAALLISTAGTESA